MRPGQGEAPGTPPPPHWGGSLHPPNANPATVLLQPAAAGRWRSGGDSAGVPPPGVRKVPEEQTSSG